jgi:putative transposase
VAFVTENKDEHGVQPIVEVLADVGLPIAPSTYYAAVARKPSRRAVRDAELKELIMKVYVKNFSVYGARKIWKELHRQGEPVARCTVERLMRELGISGAVRGTEKIRTTKADPNGCVLGDHVERDFTASAPNRLWVADFTYVATWSGVAFVAFVTDVHSRKIVGWRVADHMRTDLVLDALEMAMWHRKGEDLSGLVHHSDRGSQYTAVRYTQRLIDAGADPSVGSTGDSYDNALAESVIGLYKTELINKQAPWRILEDVELATLTWVSWFNDQRIHSSIGYRTPTEYEQLHQNQQVLVNAK